MLSKAKATNDYVFFITGHTFSGAEKRMLITAREIQAKTGRPVTVYITRALYNSIETKFSFDEFKNIALKVDPYLKGASSKINMVLRYISRFSSVLKHRNSVFHISQYQYIDCWLGKLAKTFGNKVFFEVTSPDVANSLTTRKLVSRPAYSTGIICLSANVERLVRLHEPASGVNVFCRSTPFVLDDAVVNMESKSNAVVFAHRLIQRKNPALAVKVFLVIAEEYPDWDFLVCGQGPLSDEIEQQIAAGARDNVKFLGFRSDIKNIVNTSKIFVSLIEPDNYPSQSVLEAMSSGCALVLSDTGQSKKTFISDHEPNGFSVELTEASVSEHLRKLIECSLLEQMCRNSTEHFKRNFSLDTYIKDSIELYER